MNKLGQSPIYKTPDAMCKVLDVYFKKTPDEELTLTGIILALGFGKDTFYEYRKREKFAFIINNARLRVEHSYEMDLRRNPNAGNIFALKNFGWIDTPPVTVENHTHVTFLNSAIKKAEDVENGRCITAKKSTEIVA